jgi:deoxyadenosine/deoxycytidine kinase
MEAWSFHSQLYFLTRRLRIHKQLLDAEGSVVQDRSVTRTRRFLPQPVSAGGYEHPRLRRLPGPVSHFD